jgi:uncharacterized protein (TIGR02001 family)
MQKIKWFVAAVCALLAVPVLAEDAAVTQHKEDIHVIPASAHTLTSNISLVSDYLYRGISQTGTKPAIQGGFDYAHSSGFYAGAWGSSISWISDTYAASGGTSGANNAGLELDTYLGFKHSFATDFTYDVGYLCYNYPGSYAPGATRADTDEIYGLVGYKWITAKYSYSLGDTFGVPDARGTDYIDLSASYPLADTGITLGVHVGKQKYRGSSAAYVAAGGPSASYTDYRLSVTRDFSGFVLGLAYSNTSANGGAGQFYNVLGRDLGRDTVVLSLSRSF